MTLDSKLRALVAECDALRKDRYNTTNWDPKAMQLLFYCAEAMREALLAERQEPPELDYIHIEAAARRGLFAWRDKPHNAKWWKKIDGTPIPNDLIVCVAQEISRMLAAAPCSGTGERK